MSGKYSKPVTVASELPGLLKEFTRELLFHQPDPDQLYQFGLEHFDKKLAEERSASVASAAGGPSCGPSAAASAGVAAASGGGLGSSLSSGTSRMV